MKVLYIHIEIKKSNVKNERERERKKGFLERIK
jgi:hypothetical protein